MGMKIEVGTRVKIVNCPYGEFNGREGVVTRDEYMVTSKEWMREHTVEDGEFHLHFFDGDIEPIAEARDTELTSPYGDGNHPLPPMTGTPKKWGEMTDAEKGELLLAAHEGKAIENNATKGKWITAYPMWEDEVSYRIRQEPKRETVTLYGGWNGDFTDWGNDNDAPDYRITFDTIDGKPATGMFRNDNGDVIKMEEV